MKLLSGQELADYIKERQAHQVRQLTAQGIHPQLVIFYDNDNPIITKYMSLKQQYGADIGITTIIKKITPADATEQLATAAKDPETHGIIIQLPLKQVQSSILTHIPPEKDVDGLNNGRFTSATAEAIHWLITGYGIDLKGKNIAIVGHGQLVGAPLARIWQNSGHSITIFKKGQDLTNLVNFDIIVTATGVAGLITPAMLRIGAIVIDAGTSSENGVLKGDLDDEARTRQDLTLTPKIGGVGPLTVATLFDHTLQAATHHRP